MRMINLQSNEKPPILKFGISRQKSELHFLTIFGKKQNCLLKEYSHSYFLQLKHIQLK